MPLSAEEIAFFESSSEPGVVPSGSSKAVGSVEWLNQFGGLNLVSTSANETVDPAQTEVEAAGNGDSEDEFGDFVESESTLASVEPVEPGDGGRGVSDEHGSQGPELREKENGKDELYPAPKPQLFVKEVRKPVVSLQSQIDDLGAYKPGIKFGQHLATSKNTFTGEIEQKPTVTSKKQWNFLLDSHYGDFPRKPASTSIPKVSKEPRIQTSSDQSHRKTVDDPGGSHTSNLIPDVDPWDFENGSSLELDFSPGPDVGFEQQSEKAVDPPEVLLKSIRLNVLPLLENFLKSLVPLSYALKRRVMAQQATIDFLTAFLECVWVAARISAGRVRRLNFTNARAKGTSSSRDSSTGSPKINSKATTDIEAKRFADSWAKLSLRLDSLVPGNSPLRTFPELSPEITFSNRTTLETCIVCGLTKTELIKGERKHSWTQQGHGHSSCLKLWDNIDTIDNTRATEPHKKQARIESLI